MPLLEANVVVVVVADFIVVVVIAAADVVLIIVVGVVVKLSLFVGGGVMWDISSSFCAKSSCVWCSLLNEIFTGEKVRNLKFFYFKRKIF